MRFKLFSASCLMLTAFAGCTQSNGKNDNKLPGGLLKKHQGSYPIKAVATTGMVADMVRNVGGKHVSTMQLFGQDVDPHLYQATNADTAKLASANIIFYSGLHLEGKMTEIFESLGRKTPCIAVADQLDPQRFLKDEEGATDPHVWFDVPLWATTADVVRDALSKYDPNNADDYKANAAKYQKELEDLHTYVQKRLAEIPDDHRVLITSHDAFEYFGKAYIFEVKAIQGISTVDEASLAKITKLVDFLVERKVKAVFVETSVPARNMQSLIEGCAAKKHKVLTGGELFSDAMGAEGTPEGTYIGMIRHNVDTIVNALK